MFIIEEMDDIPVIRINNFLDTELIERLYQMLETYKPHFGVPNWTSNSGDRINESIKKKSLCSGKDIWFPSLIQLLDIGQVTVPEITYELIENYFLHQGILEFTSRSKWPVFRLIPHQAPDGRLHIITYGDGDYYNWHKDHSLGEGPFIFGKSPPRHNLFTFSLNLCKNDKMEGGHLLYMHDNRTIEIPFAHNSLSIFPSIVYHAATKVEMNDEDKWLNRRVSCQLWMAGSQMLSHRDRREQKWPDLLATS